MTDQTTAAAASELRPVYNDPDEISFNFAEDDDFCENPIEPGVGWDLSFGCKVSFGYYQGQLRATVSMSDRDLANAGTVRGITREQLAAFARRALEVSQLLPSGLKERHFEFVMGTAEGASVECKHCRWKSVGSRRTNPQEVFDRSCAHECSGVESYAAMRERQQQEREAERTDTSTPAPQVVDVQLPEPVSSH